MFSFSPSKGNKASFLSRRNRFHMNPQNLSFYTIRTSNLRCAFFSLEGVINLFERLDRMASFEPEWIDVTWGAGGSTAQKTLEICATAQKYCGLETMMHLTCTNMPRAQIDDALRQAKAAGIQNILALRGGTPPPPSHIRLS
jgi:hypothetical protein